MQKTSILLIVLTFGIISNGNAQTKQKVKNNQTTQTTNKKMENNFNDEQKKVFNTIEKMVTAFQNKDIDGVLATYEDNAIVMFEPLKPVQGKEALRAFFTQFVGMNPQYTFSSHEIYISGNIATHIAPWKMVGQLPDGTKIEQSGLSVAILRKQADGNWLMIQDNPHGQFLLGNN
ncbi:YybH family protein [Flavobacterium sp. UBA7682]|uniref:YybH family protein n=1 Tax=Flavobacterium sp. UBA7682 TaxID=1946560 RepID=UPI0025C2CA02|nr:nuclear transport factor 2 family protein [Flavobacterium sp. UBA7682]